MLIKLLAHPFFWIGIYLFGYSITIVVLSLGAMQKKVESRSPKPLVRIFILTTFIAPPLILPFTKGPKMVIPSPFTLTVEILHKVSLRENFHDRRGQTPGYGHTRRGLTPIPNFFILDGEDLPH
ncbi:hypothetical protein ES703_22293 [subsurface metagenome]